MKHIDLSPDNIRLAVWSAFPKIETFRVFKNEKRNISVADKFIELAFQKNLINKKNNSAFENLLGMSGELYKSRKPPMEFTFDTLLKEIKKDKSIKSLVSELTSMARAFAMEEPDEVLFTRMRKDFHVQSVKRQHAVMLLAIWLGLNKPFFALSYDTIMGFPRSSSEPLAEDVTGVLASLSFVGENIDASTVDFLKKELPVCIKDLKLSYLNEKRVNFMATSCLARFPLKEGAAGYASTFGQAMRDALSLAYQMIITWQLSPMYNNRISFIIAIDAGNLSSAEISIKDLLSPYLPAESPIRLSHFAFTAAKQADLKVVFKSIKYPNVWSADHFWAFPYFRSAPVLMPDGTDTEHRNSLLPVTDEAVGDFRNALFLGQKKDFRILSIINQYPPRILSSLEIAHIATLRRLHHEAVQLLSNILSFDPLNYIARTLRFHNFMSLGCYAKDPRTAELLFERGIYDGKFIEDNCPQDPEFYAEYSLVYWAKAVKLIKFLRKGAIKEAIDKKKAEVFECIKQGERCAKKGLAASTSGADSRCAYWLLYFMAFGGMLERNPGLMTDIRKPLEDASGVYYEIFQSFAEGFGFAPTGGNGAVDETFLEMRSMLYLDKYLSSLSSTSQYPHAAFGVCTFLWDFSGPERKRKVIDHVLLLLEIIRMKIEDLKPLCLGTYSATPSLIEIQSPGEYIACVETARRAVEQVKKSGNYETGMKLLLINLDFETNDSPITFDLIRKENAL